MCKNENFISCDLNYGGSLGCHPDQELPNELEETFDQPWQDGNSLLISGLKTNAPFRSCFVDNFKNVIGGEIVAFNQLVNGDSMEMRSAGIRLLQTISINTIDTKYLQFYLSVYSKLHFL